MIERRLIIIIIIIVVVVGASSIIRSMRGPSVSVVSGQMIRGHPLGTYTTWIIIIIYYCYYNVNMYTHTVYVCVHLRYWALSQKQLCLQFYTADTNDDTSFAPFFFISPCFSLILFRTVLSSDPWNRASSLCIYKRKIFLLYYHFFFLHKCFVIELLHFLTVLIEKI